MISSNIRALVIQLVTNDLVVGFATAAGSCSHAAAAAT